MKVLPLQCGINEDVHRIAKKMSPNNEIRLCQGFIYLYLFITVYLNE